MPEDQATVYLLDENNMDRHRGCLPFVSSRSPSWTIWVQTWSSAQRKQENITSKEVLKMSLNSSDVSCSRKLSCNSCFEFIWFVQENGEKTDFGLIRMNSLNASTSDFRLRNHSLNDRAVSNKWTAKIRFIALVDIGFIDSLSDVIPCSPQERRPFRAMSNDFLSLVSLSADKMPVTETVSDLASDSWGR